MKIALVCPSNMLYMPYVNNYINVLNGLGINYDIINWDRFKIEEEDYLSYRDKKNGHQRNYFDYLKYKKYVIKTLKSNNYDKVIVFGIQLSYFLKRYLIRNYKGNLIIDIRDYNKIMKFFNFSKIANASSFVVVSSPGFKTWLPKNEEYVINHNTNLEKYLPIIDKKADDKNNVHISISYIGSVRDLDVNIDLLNALKNNETFFLNYHGDGIIIEKLKDFIQKERIKNVKLTGRYTKDTEDSFYKQSNLINIIIPKDNINSRTLLPNRLYKAVEHGIPILTMGGTYLASIISEYKLGIVLKDFSTIGIDIVDYLSEIDETTYEKNRFEFISQIIKDNSKFIRLLESFILN